MFALSHVTLAVAVLAVGAVLTVLGEPLVAQAMALAPPDSLLPEIPHLDDAMR